MIFIGVLMLVIVVSIYTARKNAKVGFLIIGLVAAFILLRIMTFLIFYISE